jgi:zinc transporter, ZIP family
VGGAIGLGALGSSSLVLGAVLGLARSWPPRLIGLVLAFGAGALLSAVSFELAEEGAAIGGGVAVGVGLAVGALSYFLLARVLDRVGADKASAAGSALALGAG